MTGRSSSWQTAAKRRSRSLARGAAGVLHDPPNWRCELELARLQGLPAFEPGVTRLLGTEVAYTHPQSIVVQYRTIFQQECYRFRCERVDPVIFDCGANIGLATLFWLRQYPMATVVAFEPDRADLRDVLGERRQRRRRRPRPSRAVGCLGGGWDDVVSQARGRRRPPGQR